MLTNTQIFNLIGFDTDAMEKYKYSESNAVLTPHLNNGPCTGIRTGALGRAKSETAPRTELADEAEKVACRRWALRQMEMLKQNVSNAVLLVEGQ